jgi:hypothetical protein
MPMLFNVGRFPAPCSAGRRWSQPMQPGGSGEQQLAGGHIPPHLISVDGQREAVPYGGLSFLSWPQTARGIRQDPQASGRKRCRRSAPKPGTRNSEPVLSGCRCSAGLSRRAWWVRDGVLPSPGTFRPWAADRGRNHSAVDAVSKGKARILRRSESARPFCWEVLTIQIVHPGNITSRPRALSCRLPAWFFATTDLHSPSAKRESGSILDAN